MKIKIFFAKAKKFIKKNVYAITVGACSAIALVAVAMIAILASTSSSVDNTTQIPVETVTPTAIVFSNPIEGAQISKEFANNKLLEDKTSGYWQTHLGIDIKATEGTSVMAVFDGTIESVEKTMMEGTVITISHSDTLKSIYKCLSDNNVQVKKGDTVKKGEKIGEVGQSLKEKADGAHLHFEVIENNKNIDPFTYLDDEDAK